MSKKRPSDAQLAEMLTTPHFGQRRPETPPEDPITATPMVVEIDAIDFYDRNPRRSPNDKYHEIKASMAAGEMDQPLTITRRVGAQRYMVFKGGNTRLRALKELYSETGEERFHRIHCLFQPWTRESDALLGHLKENDLRGDLIFIDRALAVRELRELISNEIEEDLSLRRFETVLKERGYRIGKTLLGWFDYAVDVLYQTIPVALQAGMGRPQIERIKTLDRAFGQCWLSLGLGADNMAQDVFVEVMSRHDAEQLDLDAIRRDLETELTVSADIDLQRASLLFGAALDGRPMTESPKDSDEKSSLSPAGATTITGTPLQEDYPSGSATRSTSEDGHTEDASAVTNDAVSRETGPSPVIETAAQTPAKETQKRPAVGAYQDATNPAIVNDPVPTNPTLDDLPVLRERAWALARGVTVMARLGPDIVHPIPSGVGYLVGPNSYEVIAQAEQQLGADHINHLRYLWWTLAGISEQFMPDNRAAEYLPDHWRNRPLEEGIAVACKGGEPDFPTWHMAAKKLFGTGQEPRAEAMWQDIPPASINFLGALLWPRMSDYAKRALFVLIDVYCAIRTASDGKVWK
ncbi:ParB family protein [Thiohalobacter sp. COW1]|uniref:ParB family protein n=1 Tax=Thiohalobacter sp. COW1 TaxID=2795687 RepID=UPI0019154203|nr:ParB family protein [Thiohalobacter sp. COW1]